MERLIPGESVSGSESSGGRAPFCSFSMLVEQGHGECGDSAFVFHNKERLIAGVFDGVSGDPCAAIASADAAKAVMSHLKGIRKPSEKDVEDAFTAGQLAIRLGATTASVLVLCSDGSFIIASIGDSPVFSLERGGRACLELPLARVVSEGDSILKFFHFRNYVSSVLGSDNELKLHMRSGKLKKGESFIIASDGLGDNLAMEAEDGYVIDSSGESDLKNIIGKKREPGEIIRAIMSVLHKRIKGGRKEDGKSIIVPKEDDIAIIAVRFG